MKEFKKYSMQRHRKKVKQAVKRVGMLIALFAVVMMFCPELQAFAATPTPSPTPAPAEVPDLSNFQPLMILRIIYVLFMSVVAIIGGIQVVKGVQEWSTAMQQNDNAGTSAAIKGIVGGAIQAFVSVLMGIFGIVV